MGPVRDQRDCTWCFAFVGADLLSQHLKQDPKNRVSAFDIGLQYYKTDTKGFLAAIENVWNKKFAQVYPDIVRENTLNHFGWVLARANLENRSLDVSKMVGGWSRIGMALANEFGVCSENNLPSEIPAAFKDREDHILKTLQRAQARDTEEKLAQSKNCTGISPLPPLFAVESLARAVDKENSKDILNSVQYRCRQRIPVPPFLPQFYVLSGKENISLINKSLSLDVPVGIVYDSHKIFGKDARVTPVGYNHESSIVGRRWNKKTNQCEFKLRNSWGPDWCPKKAFPAHRCEAGNVWLTDKELEPFIVATTSIAAAP